jgi:hypothetical protein
MPARAVAIAVAIVQHIDQVLNPSGFEQFQENR